jgi:small multidrug resistance pump
MRWVALVTAISSGVAASMSLRPAVTGRPAFFGIVVAGYLAAFGALTVALSEGMAMGVAYGIWVASDVALVALLSKLIFDEPLTRLMASGIGLIISGVLLVELGAQ